MVKRSIKNEGFIAILSLLIIATVSMLIAISLLKDGVDNAVLSIQSIYYETAKLNSTICLEDSLLRMKMEEQFDQELNYAINPDQSCSTNLTWYSPVQIEPGIVETLVDLEITGVSNNFARTFKYELKVKQYAVNDVDASLNYTNNIDVLSVEELDT